MMFKEDQAHLKEHLDYLLTCDVAIDYLMDKFGEDYVAGTMDDMGMMAGQDGEAIINIYKEQCPSTFDHSACRNAQKRIDELSQAHQHYIFVDIYDDDSESGFHAPLVRPLTSSDCRKLADTILSNNE